MHTVVLKALAYLESEYRPELVVLYGSFADGTQTPESDLDLLVFADGAAARHDATTIERYPLDAWIHPVSALEQVEKYRHATPCIALKDNQGLFKTFSERLDADRASLSTGFTEAELDQIQAWVMKMLNRSRGDTAEANYRYHWLLTDFPELYCKMTARYYDGPVKTVRRMEKDAPALHSLYRRLLAGEKDIELAAQMYSMVGLVSN